MEIYFQVFVVEEIKEKQGVFKINNRLETQIMFLYNHANKLPIECLL